ncbi:MAG TPA: GtrA family protein [Atribacteraceae bacterium]|nr:GtrA family protein [Atribacteraceae bacterium]
MNNPLKKLLCKYRSDLWQVSKFGIVGVLNTGVDFGLFSLLYLAGGLHYLLAQVLSYGTATCNSYMWNRYWTFQTRHRPQMSEFMKFIFVNILSLGVSLLILTLLHEQLGLGTILSKVIATFFAMLVNYSGNRLWVFRKRLIEETGSLPR